MGDIIEEGYPEPVAESSDREDERESEPRQFLVTSKLDGGSYYRDVQDRLSE